jgi:hypothetical protein
MSYSAGVSVFRLSVLGRFGVMSARLGEVSSGASRQFGAELLAGLGLPFDLGGWELQPSVGLGAGWNRTERSEGAGEGALIRDGFAVNDVTPKAELALSIVAPVDPDVLLAVRGGVSVSPWARSLSAVPEYAKVLPEFEQAPFALPGEPAVTARLAVGVRFQP